MSYEGTVIPFLGSLDVTNTLPGQWQHHRTRSCRSHQRGQLSPEECDLRIKSMIAMRLAEDIELGMRLSGYS